MPSPLCRCRVLYIGSAVPTVTKDGLQGIQEPLRERYPVDHNSDTKGIDSWLSVWSNGLLLEYIEGNKKTEAAFYPINSLHYCAAVRYVNVSGYEVEGGGERFLPLDSPFANLPNSEDPPIFAAILRRTTGIKVLECHAFICTNAKAANALVRCCFHSYADSMYVKMEEKDRLSLHKNNGIKAIKDKDSDGSSTPKSEPPENGYHGGTEDNLDEGDILRFTGENRISKPNWQSRQQTGDYETASISSSLAGRYKKRENGRSHARAASEIGGSSIQGKAIVPIGHLDWSQRRANSELNLHRAAVNGTLPRGGGGPLPLMLPPNGPQAPPVIVCGPEGPMGPQGPMGPHMGPPMGPPGFPVMMQRPGMRPMPPEMMFGPGPPNGMMPPQMVGTGPGFPPMMMNGPPPMYGPPPPQGMERGPHPGFPDGMGGLPQGGPIPIIVHPADSPYGTMRRRAFEEPVYVSGPPPSHVIPPDSSYHPSAYPPDQYDAYYDSYMASTGRRSGDKLRKGPPSTTSSRQRSEVGVVGVQESFWENNNVYESGGIFRKQPYLNEKAFITSIERENNNRPGYGGEDEVFVGRVHRPATPPADYDSPRMNGRVNGVQEKHLEDSIARMTISDMDDRPVRQSGRAQMMY